MTCKKRTEWGRCKQPAASGGRCSAHLYWHAAGVTPNRYFEEKIVRGLITPGWDWMTESETHAVINGRYRGDGRRIDQWTVPEGPMEIDMESMSTLEMRMEGGPLDGVVLEFEASSLDDPLIVEHKGQLEEYELVDAHTYRWAGPWG